MLEVKLLFVFVSFHAPSTPPWNAPFLPCYRVQSLPCCMRPRKNAGPMHTAALSLILLHRREVRRRKRKKKLRACTEKHLGLDLWWDAMTSDWGYKLTLQTRATQRNSVTYVHNTYIYALFAQLCILCFNLIDSLNLLHANTRPILSHVDQTSW